MEVQNMLRMYDTKKSFLKEKIRFLTAVDLNRYYNRDYCAPIS